ncbi:hypothetical protein HELRODRAFT_84503 [Helobdella robusta]|uniref:Protein kinase domain-containing protein n=1 Tax=Helobdella robusta TaxID=6412 RepID=T1G5J3_HELRO|nr:hypothetical protein HELRODRAFT_84503 [Helobdella robusta]ESN98570.1 hypothetical protein HELRODRAFT_84503 [Helobdella robusta]
MSLIYHQHRHRPTFIALQIQRYLGKGAFGCVKAATRRSSNRQVVVKFIKISKIRSDGWIDYSRISGMLPYEVYILSHIQHPNIVRMLDFHVGLHYMQLVMEKHGDGTDLFDFIERCTTRSEELVRYIFRQIATAVKFLHDSRIVHRDIKDENIIINESFHIKLVDFGSAAIYRKWTLFDSFCGTMEYCPPEVIKGEKYKGPEVDVWALGTTLFTLWSLESAYLSKDDVILHKRAPLPPDTSLDLAFLIGWILARPKEFRPTLDQVMRNRWYNQPTDISKFKYSEVCAPKKRK